MMRNDSSHSCWQGSIRKFDKFSWFGCLVGFVSAHGGFPVIPSFHVMRVFLAVDVHSAMCTFRNLSWYQPVYIYDQ